jgi:hypothetical protein
MGKASFGGDGRAYRAGRERSETVKWPRFPFAALLATPDLFPELIQTPPLVGVLIPLSHDLAKHLSVDIGEPMISPGAEVGELFVVEPHQVKNGRVQVVHVRLV